MKRIITATVQDRSGILNRITGMLHRRQYNIESISVGTSETPGISKMTLVVEVSDLRNLEQLTKQLNKQIDVIKVNDITDKAMVARELALIKVASNPQLIAEIQGVISLFRASVIDLSKDSIAQQVTGNAERVEALITMLRPYGIQDFARTGVNAFIRGHQPENPEVSAF